jgi:hypothetical protein
MFKVVENKPAESIELRELRECNFSSGIILAEEDDIQDILIYDGEYYQWSSLYCRPRKRSKYHSIIEAVQSRLKKGMSIYVFQNRGEFRDFLKYRGSRQ